MASEEHDDALRPGAAYALFALIMVGAPLLFGATDRFFQVFLLAAFALGLYLAPPLVWRMGSRAWIIAAAVLAMVLAKEFAPAALFGATDWRQTLVENFGLRLPWTHHPEPVRALESILTVMIGVLWLAWARTLARGPEGAKRVLWILLIAGATVGAVSLFFGTSETSSIYGIREVPGYKGFGPFPNRNHTASFLTMTTVVGLGVMFHKLRAKKIPGGVVALSLILLALVALLETQSRGGLLALAAGVIAFAGALLLRTPNRKLLAAILAAGLIGLTVLFISGEPLWERLTNVQEVGRDLRWTVWEDAKAMWLAAPLFGHGLGSFGSVFPMYQSIIAGNTVVLHPESSWLQWLTEMGLLFTLATAIAGMWWMGRAWWNSKGEADGTLRAAALAAVAALLVHSIYDVPAHRWATMACALAALGVVCPARETGTRLSRGWALFPVAVAALWLVPLLTLRPLWSTSTLGRALAANFSSNQVPLRTLDRLARYFPLHPDLQHSLGMRSLMNGGPPSETWRRFRLANRLKPSSYLLPTGQAVVAAPVSRDMALHFWTVAIERAEHRAEDFFLMAWDRTKEMPGAMRFWRQYAMANPSLLLSYARAATPEDQGDLLREWMQRRQEGLQPFELINFYSFLPRWGTAADLQNWMEAHPERKATDAHHWARILHDFGKDEQAWQLLSELHPEPSFLEEESDRNAAELEYEWQSDPDDFLKARRLVGALHRAGEEARRDQVILTMASKADAPEWFLRRAAYIYARAGQLDEAAARLLQAEQFSK